MSFPFFTAPNCAVILPYSNKSGQELTSLGDEGLEKQMGQGPFLQLP